MSDSNSNTHKFNQTILINQLPKIQYSMIFHFSVFIKWRISSDLDQIKEKSNSKISIVHFLMLHSK
jgi:hypothetical protein